MIIDINVTHMVCNVCKVLKFDILIIASFDLFIFIFINSLTCLSIPYNVHNFLYVACICRLF